MNVYLNIKQFVCVAKYAELARLGLLPSETESDIEEEEEEKQNRSSRSHTCQQVHIPTAKCGIHTNNSEEKPFRSGAPMPAAPHVPLLGIAQTNETQSQASSQLASLLPENKCCALEQNLAWLIVVMMKVKNNIVYG